MKKFLDSIGLVKYINVLFKLLAIFLIIIIAYRFFNQNTLLQNEKYKEISTFAKELDFSLKEKVSAISYLESSATLLLNSPSKNCQSIVSMVNQPAGSDYYTIDDAYHKELEVTHRTNLTGYGDLNGGKIDENELCMALSLNPLLATVGNLIKDSAWIYYTSKEGFINLFPYVHSDDFRLREEDMNKECFTYGTPKLNDKRELFWTPLYVDAGGLGLMASIGKPVYHDDKFKGVVALDMTLEHLNDMMLGLKKHEGSTLIVNAQNQVIATDNIQGFFKEKIILDSEVLSREILDAKNSRDTFIELEDVFLYKVSLENAPWHFIFFIEKNEIYQKVVLNTMPGVLLFVFMLFGRELVKKIISTQDKLEALNNNLEEKVGIKVKELAIQKSSYETLFERAGSGICILKKAKIIECNDNFVHLLGADSKEELIGHYVLEFAPNRQEDGKSSLQSARKFQRALIKEGEHTWEWRGMKKDGTLIWMEIVSKVIMVNGKKVVQLITQDISKRKQLEKTNHEQMNQLLQQSRLAQMGEMLSMISHQWRQPLSSIGMVAMNLEVKVKSGKLRKDDEGDAFLLDKIGHIERYVQFLATTIDDFSNFFKPQKEKKEFLINALIDETVELISPTLEVKQIEVIKDYQAENKIISYENEIKQVILNIINNAKDALLEKEIVSPSIMIRTYCENNHCFIEIEDNGGGVDEKYLGQVFDPYFSTKSKNGTGLGLYMSKTIIEEHCNGSLSVCNSDKGAVFTIALTLS